MESKSIATHTPGPWRVILAPTQVVTDDKIIADIGHAHGDDKYANADLIASAPDLLEACKIMLEFMNFQNIPHNTNEAIEFRKYQKKILVNVIAKAEGRDA